MTTNDASGGYHYEPFSTQNPEDMPEQIVLVKVPYSGDLDEDLANATQKLMEAGSGWRLKREPDGTHPFVIPIKVTYEPVGPAEQSRLDIPSALDKLRHPIPILLDQMFIPDPGHRTNGPTRGDVDRVPVAVLAKEPPPRKAVSGRRPVVALLDTAVEPHEWLGAYDTGLGGDGFWVNARRMGWDPGPLLDPPKTVKHRELGEAEGHGTFSAGLVRQIAPDAQVLAVQVFRDDGRVYGHHLLNALHWLVKERLEDEDQVLRAGDVVCIPAGFQPVFPGDRPYLRLLGTVLARLAERGIRVVAAAGNDGSADPVYPAAFAVSEGVPEGVRLVSVGATNPDGKTPAYFSNHGRWVTRWEVGTSVLSIFPMVNRAAAPALVIHPHREDPDYFPARETPDPDDFVRRKPTSSDDPPAWELNEDEVELTGGFARWSGTSFAAAIHAAKLAQERVGPAHGAGAAPPVLG